MHEKVKQIFYNFIPFYFLLPSSIHNFQYKIDYSNNNYIDLFYSKR